MTSKLRGAQPPIAAQIYRKSVFIAAAAQAQVEGSGWDPRRAYALKFSPKHYGENIAAEITGSSGGQTLQMPDWTAIRVALARTKDGPRNETPVLIERGNE